MNQDQSNLSSNHVATESISQQSFKKMIVGVLALGFISGGAAGALVPTVLQTNSSNNIQFGKDYNLSNLETQKVLVEESSAINTVKNATDSVVSIIIEQEQSSQSQSFGQQFPFDFGFNIPGFDISPNQAPSPITDFPESEEPEYIQVGSGSGFVVSEDGLILTNKHVVNQENVKYSILTSTGDTYEVEVLGIDPVNDLAVVKTIENVTLPALDLGDSDQIQIGQTVLAIGNSLGEFSNTVTKGVISGQNRTVTASDGNGKLETIETAIQTDAAINPGNSGGPLLNVQGQVIGVNTAVSQEGQLIGFAIPINEAKRLINNIQEYGKVIRPFIGVRYIILNKRIAQVNNLDIEYGALLRRGDNPSELAVIPGSPADKAGLEENDIILEVAGQKIDESNSLARVLGKNLPGEEVLLKVLKDGVEQEITIILGEFEAE